MLKVQTLAHSSYTNSNSLVFSHFQVNETWKSISKFFDAQQAVIEQVQNIINNKNEEQVLDSANINFKVSITVFL